MEKEAILLVILIVDEAYIKQRAHIISQKQRK